MTALASDKTRQRLDTPIQMIEPAVAANAKIYQGSLVGVLAATGLAQAFATSTTLKAVGVSLRLTDNTGGAAAAMRVGCETGDFEFENSTAGDLLTLVDIGNVVYGVDDNTVAKLATGRSVAGILVSFGPLTGKPIVRVGLGLGST